MQLIAALQGKDLPCTEKFMHSYVKQISDAFLKNLSFLRTAPHPKSLLINWLLTKPDLKYAAHFPLSLQSESPKIIQESKPFYLPQFLYLFNKANSTEIGLQNYLHFVVLHVKLLCL